MVAGGSNVEVSFWNGAAFTAKVVGSDPSTDLAVLEVNAPRRLLEPLRLADSSAVDVGDPVYALGSRDGPGAAYYYGQSTNGEEGGAGGSFGTSGGNLAVSTLGNAELLPLIGGMSGQDSCNGAHGGGGGGAVQISAGVSIDIPLGTTFQLRSHGQEPLRALGATMPPWPGPGEAILTEGPWTPTVRT